MVFMVRLIPGLLLFFLCVVETTEVGKPQTKIKSYQFYQREQNTTNESNSNRNDTENSFKNIREITDKDVENIVKPFEFSKINNENITSIKLKKSESYTTTQKTNPEHSRTGSGRSVDIDIEKFISPDFHNAVYTLPVSANTKQYASDEDFHSQYSTEEVSSFENVGHLTTPKTPFFDQKYKETVESVNQKLELESPAKDSDNISSNSNSSSDNFIDDLDRNPKLEYKNVESIELNKTEKPSGSHKDSIHETQTIVNYESQYNKTISYDERTPNEESNELHKENIKSLLGDENINEVRKQEVPDKSTSTVRTNFHITTGKYSITKPSTDKSDSGIISNKIESETLKFLSTTTPLNFEASKTEIPLNRTSTTRRGSIKFADYQKLSTSTVPSLRENKTLEQIVQENQIVPVQVTPPEKIFEVTTEEQVDSDSFGKNGTQETTTFGIENASLRNFTTEPEEQQSTTVLIIVQPDGSDLDTTTKFDIYKGTTTTINSIPRGFQKTITTENILTTTDIQETTVRNEEQTIFIPEKEDEKTTTTKEDIITTAVPGTSTVNRNYVTEELTTTETQSSTMNPNEKLEVTTLPAETTTMNNDETTFNEIRSSKNMKFSETTQFVPTEPMEDSTIKTTEAFEQTTVSPSITTTDAVLTTTKLETTTETISIETTTAKDVEKTTEPTFKDTTSELSTRTIIESTPTKTLLENQTNEEKLTHEPKTTPTTSINFVHIKTIDKNHTTLLPDILKPNEIYTTPMATQENNPKTTIETTTSDDNGNSSGQDGPGGTNGAIVAIIISCVGGICLIVLACLLIVMRNRQNRFNYGQRCRPVSLDDYSVDNVSVFNSVRRKAAVRDSKRSYGNPAFEDPVCLSHPLNFPAISKFAANEEDVFAEFADIPQIIARTSELPEGCETKNRYANVIPLPESRVFLSHVQGYRNSDYINANYITGPKNIRKYYIACQAPMNNTVDDFWRMIWEQQCKVILMLTHLFENGVEKCFDYLPPSEVLDCHRLFGDFQVTLKKREVKEKYIISSIQLKNMVSNSWREVTHFWYMGWPEKGIPAEANSIIAFLIEARSFMKSATIDKKTTTNGDMNGTSLTEVNPVVVHCSPGTGRTGAVITCDIAIREFEQTRQVDIPKIVYRIRRDRASAVQTKEQYAFIYKVIDLYATKLAGGSMESI